MDTVLRLQFMADEISIIFSILSVIVYICAGIFSFEYMKHEENTKRYTVFYVISFVVFQALCFSGNMITFYLFFELLTLSTFPLVLHNGSKEAIMAGLKYLFYSLCGAYMALFGIFFIADSGIFSFEEGTYIGSAFTSDGGMTLFNVCLLLMIMGFGVKAGMFPMHAWLTSAHPVAPAPASAILSAVIVKAGVLGIIRTVNNVYGNEYVKGSPVQYIWMVITLITVFMGSMLAFREDVLKKRLAYSTVSQVSYILFGLASFTEISYKGAILQVAAHGVVKAGLFLCAGAIIYKTGKTRVSELKGIGRQMPVTMVCFTILSLSLIGIPPLGGFVSKWYLAVGSLNGNAGIMNWLGPVILLVSALLTAGYLLPVSMRGFFPGNTPFKEEKSDEPGNYDIQSENVEYVRDEAGALMTVPIIILTVLSVLIGFFPGII